MATYTQDKRPLTIETPLGKDALLLTAFSGQEEISRLFKYQLQCLSEKKSIDPKQIIGKNVTFSVEFPDGSQRYFNGLVQRFSYRGTGDRLSTYYAEVVPWLWFLTRKADCRIFQEKTVPDILKEVLKGGPVEFKLSENHPKRNYCVQYRETDFDFASRLMEEEGIFYFFKHDNGKHTLVLGDTPTAYYDLPEKDVEFETTWDKHEAPNHLLSWEHQYDYRSGKWAYRDYNFETPQNDLSAKANGKAAIPDADKFEFYDYPGEYAVKGDGDALVRFRMEGEEASYNVAAGTGICRTFSPGGKFKLSKHPNDAEKGKGYMVLSVRHRAQVDQTYVGGGGAVEEIYQNSFQCMPDDKPFRPERVTPRPMIHGAQTALVVGPPGEEIYTDKYGRVKVNFYWDREGKKDEKSSCWIRCAQFSAGKGWGMMSIPRIGQEVVVTYLEGDPDRPLVTGVVYNAEQMPAYTLPDEKTKTYFKSNSSKGGNGFNELRLEDKAGSEQIFIHAQKDMDLRVRADRREAIGGSTHLIVEKDQIEQIKGDRHINVEGEAHETIGKKSTSWIGADEERVVDGARMENIAKAQHLTIGADKFEKIGGAYSLNIAGEHNQMVKSFALDATGAIYLSGQAIVIEAQTQLSLKVGGNFVDISLAGVAINGMPAVLINSGGAAGVGIPPITIDPVVPPSSMTLDPDAADNAKTGKKSAP